MSTRHSGIRAGLFALAITLLAVPSASPQAEAIDSAVAPVGVIHSSPEEVWVDVPADLSRTWSLTLTTLIDFQYSVDPELSYLENNGQIQLGGLWIVVVPQPTVGAEVTRVLIGTVNSANGLANELSVIAGALLGVIADRVEGRPEPVVAAALGAQQVVNNYYYDYGPNYEPYVSTSATIYSTNYWGLYWWPTTTYYGWGSPWYSWYKPYYSLCYTPWWGWKGSVYWSNYCYAGGWSSGWSNTPWINNPWWGGPSWYGGYGGYNNVDVDVDVVVIVNDDDDLNGTPPGGDGGGIGTFVGVDPRVTDLDVVPTSTFPRKAYSPTSDTGGTRLPRIVVSNTEERHTPRAGPRTIVVTTSRPTVSIARSATVVAMPAVRFAPSLGRVTTLVDNGRSSGRTSRPVTSFAPTSSSRSSGLFAPTRTTSSSSRSTPTHTPSRTTVYTPAPSTHRTASPVSTRSSSPSHSVRSPSPAPQRSKPAVSRPRPSHSSPTTTRSSSRSSSRSHSAGTRSSKSSRSSSKSKSGHRPR